MPFAREIRLLSLALLDSTTTSISRPLSTGVNLYAPTTLRSLCNFPYTKFGMISLYKASAPKFLASPRAFLHTEVLNQNMTIKKSNMDKEERPLVIVLSWMMAKGKHIDKYANIYLKRGFDVLVVTLPPMDMLFPKSGAQVLASNIIQYLTDHKEYNKVLVHAFSVGAYLFAELLVKLKENETQQSDIMKRFVGLIFDSAVDCAGIPKGFPRAVSRNPLMIRILELYTNTHLKIMHETATKHYLKASDTFHKAFFHCPTMLLVSEDDVVGNPQDNTRLANNWKKQGVDVHFKCWPKSSHCAHLTNYPEEYLFEVDQFLTKIGLGIKANL